MRDARNGAHFCVSGEGESFKGERKKEATIPAPGPAGDLPDSRSINPCRIWGSIQKSQKLKHHKVVIGAVMKMYLSS